MTQSLVTSAIPFAVERADAVDAKLKQFRSELFGKEGKIRIALRGQGVHFMSITVVRGDMAEPTYLVFEMSVDGEPQHAFDTVGIKLGSFVSEILSVAGIKTAGTIGRLLASHHIRTGQGLFDIPGLDFCGTPGMSVARVKREYALARELRTYFDSNSPAGAALETVLRSLKPIPSSRHCSTLSHFPVLPLKSRQAQMSASSCLLSCKGLRNSSGRFSCC
ncbi:hypothetical protein AS026_01350 [Rhizobium altiplani]|uniref:Uncharacterized protein n=1 Tax=Rhizobium altiplani TaxID=1864509 RepID=A0A109JGG9_9HYPH|nr:hypothetical protein [Rhizobium altiplani]KWV48359.1 hypothetical protein AS026_01350 [Rhizobium altiplani]